LRPCTTNPTRRDGSRGVVLLEVVLALVIFVGASAVLLTGLTSVNAASRRMAERATGADLAVTTLSYVRLGLIERAAAGPEYFEEGLGPADWTWQVTVTPAGDETTSGLDRVDVHIRTPTNRVAHQLTAWLRQDATGEFE